MPTNNFKLFDQNKANMLSDTEYANATQRLNGVQTGVASSQLNNKFAYQSSLVAYAIAQIMNQNGLDASDTLAVSAFVGNLGGSLLQKVADRASTAEAAAGVLSNKYISPATMKAAALLLSGGTMSGILNMGNNKITNLGTPTADSDAATKKYVDGSNIFTKKHIGTITSHNVQLPFTFNDLALCRGIFIDFTAESIAHDGGGYYQFNLDAVGEENKRVPLFRMYSYDSAGTLIKNIKSKFFLSKQRASSSNTEGNTGFIFNDIFSIILPLSDPNSGYFVVTDTTANNYSVDIYWVM